MQARQLGEDQLLGGRVDHQRAVAALAAPDDDGALGGGWERVQHLVQSSAAMRRHAASQSGAAAEASMRPYPRWMASALDGLTDAQRDAVTHGGSPLLVIGGPGSGKTEVLLRRLVHLADEGLAPHRILVISAQEDLRERVELALARAHEDLAIHSFPTLCRALLSAEARHAGIDPFVDVVSPADRLAMLLDRADELELEHHDFRGRPLALFASFVRRIDRAQGRADRRRALRRLGGGRRRRRRGSASASSRPSSRRTTGCSRRAACSTRAACWRAAMALLRGDAAVRARIAARYPGRARR